MQLELPVWREGRLAEAMTWTIQRRRCADATRAQHHDHRRWLLEFFGDVPVDAVGFAEVLGYIDAESARGLMNITLRKRLVTLRMALDDARRRGLRAAGTDWWPRLEGDSRPGQDLWTYVQYRQGRLAFDPPQRIGIDVLFWTGMHLSDVLRWRRCDVNMVDGSWCRYNTKSKAIPAWLPMPEEFAALLEDWFVADGISAPNVKIAPLFWRWPCSAMARVCARAGLPKVTPLGLRRSCVSYLFELGAKKGQAPDATADFVALWIGHKGDPRTSEIIRRHYRRWTPEAIRVGSPF